ncbi:MAG TPA: four helix bundle protein [Terracidiphilus sp.]|nr:four helix bundle protein [Terracidiphilus sp.]
MEKRQPAKSFRELTVWKRAIELAVSIYRLTQSFPKEELYGMTSQLRRSAVSVPSNIAEGQGRLTSGEFRQFLGIARGSNFELQTQLEIARELQFGSRDELDRSEALSHEVGKMIFAILDKVESRSKVN